MSSKDISLNPADYPEYKVMTNTFLFKTENGVKKEIALGKKKKGWMTGIFNGYGGKLEPNESVDDAAKRELFEESGVKSDSLQKIAIFTQTFQDKPKVFLEIHVFTAIEWEGEVIETEEMAPHWFPLDQIPYDNMWGDDRVWYPVMLSDKKFKAHFHFTGDSIDGLIWHTIEVIDEL